MQDYVYTEEDQATHKTVTLLQHDDRTSASGGADFTSKEDMGWNCIGLPYLVAEYKPYEQETFTGQSHYLMDIPHKLWLYYDGLYHADGTTEAEGDGGYAAVSSWDASDWHLPVGETARIWVGEGFFTQTAAVSDTEPLVFYRPVYSESAPSKGMVSFGTRLYRGELMEDDVAEPLRIYSQGHKLHVTGLQGGELVSIYDPSGRVYHTATAPAYRYSASVPVNGVYIVKVTSDGASKVKKVLVK